MNTGQNKIHSTNPVKILQSPGTNYLLATVKQYRKCLFLFIFNALSAYNRYDLQNSAWIYKHTQQSLHELLNLEIGKNILGLEDAGFEDLFCGRSET